jgi:hypothetical protein
MDLATLEWVNSEKFIGYAYLKGSQLIVCGEPREYPGLPEDHPMQHNCDKMGCSSADHIVLRINLPSPFTG